MPITSTSSSVPVITASDGATYTVKELPVNLRPGIAYREYMNTPSAIAIPTVEVKFGSNTSGVATLLVAIVDMVRLAVQGYHNYLRERFIGIDPTAEAIEHLFWVAAGLTDYNHMYLSKANQHAGNVLYESGINTALVGTIMGPHGISAIERNLILSYFRAALHGIYVTERMRVHININDFNLEDSVCVTAIRFILAELCNVAECFPGAYYFEVIIKVPSACEAAIRRILSPPNSTATMTAAQALEAGRVRNWQFSTPTSTTTHAVTTNQELENRPTFVHITSRLFVKMEV